MKYYPINQSLSAKRAHTVTSSPRASLVLSTTPVATDDGELVQVSKQTELNLHQWDNYSADEFKLSAIIDSNAVDFLQPTGAVSLSRLGASDAIGAQIENTQAIINQMQAESAPQNVTE